MKQTPDSARAFYEGRVHGVGFRYSVVQLARGYDVRGFVRNLPDGRVELQVTGARDELEDFLKGVKESHLGGHIKQVVVDWGAAEKNAASCKGVEIWP